MDPSVATIIGALVGAVLAGPFAYFFSTHLLKRQEFNRAAASFRAAFINDLKKLRKLAKDPDKFGDDDFINYIEDSIDRHEIAAIEFEPYLSKSKKHDFDETWKRYCYPKGGNPEKMPGPGIEYVVGDNVRDAIRAVILNIEALLFFAKPK